MRVLHDVPYIALVRLCKNLAIVHISNEIGNLIELTVKVERGDNQIVP